MHWSILILISLSLACSKKEAPISAEPEQAAETETALSDKGTEPTPDPAEEFPEELKGDTPADGAPPVVKVLERGKEPRQRLHWTLEPGVEQRVAMDVGFGVEGVVQILKVSDPSYIVSMGLTLRAKEVDTDGAFPVVFAVDDLSVDPSAIGGGRRAAQIQEALVSIRKLTGRYRMHPRGHIADIEVEMPSKATRRAHDIADNLRWALLQMTPVFPEELLGDGAQWTVHRSLLQGGIQINQLTTIELLSAKGAQVDLRTAQVQTADRQPFMNPGFPREMTLLKLDGTGTGQVTWDLSQLMPRSAEVAVEVTKGVRQISADSIKRRADSILQVERTVTIGRKPDDSR